MTVALWDVAEITAVADAIRAKTGKSATMKVSEMPAEIASIPTGSPEEWRECWLEKPKDSPTTLFIDTGVKASSSYSMVYTCRSSAAQMSAPFNSCSSSGNRYGVNFLPTSNKLQLYWGTWADTNYTVDRGTLDVVQQMVITQTYSNISITGSTSSGSSVTLNIASAGTASGDGDNYKLFTYARNTSIHFGLFRRAQIKHGTDNIAIIVPEVSSLFRARLKITEGNNNTVRYVDIPAGFVCHVDNEVAS